jgi:hypothetical protein
LQAFSLCPLYEYHPLTGLSLRNNGGQAKKGNQGTLLKLVKNQRIEGLDMGRREGDEVGKVKG